MYGPWPSNDPTGIVDYSNRSSGGLSNWVVGGTSVSPVGAQSIPPALPFTWTPGQYSGGAASTLATGTFLTYQAYTIAAAVAGVTQQIGKARVDEIRGMISISVFGVNSLKVCIGVGIYVSGSSNAAVWEVLDPLDSADAGRDKWLFLRMVEGTISSQAAPAGPGSALEIPISIPGPVVIGGGQAVHVAVSYRGAAASSVYVTSGFRSRVGPIA